MSLLRFRLVVVVSLVLGLAASEARAETRVVFVNGEATEDDAELRDAVLAQLAGTGAEVIFARFVEGVTTLRRQASGARSLARQHDATGVFWLETAPDGDWLLYLAEPDADRILVRRLEVESNAAGLEAVGVITANSTAALQSGQSIGMVPVEMKSEPWPEPPPEPPASGPVRAEGDSAIVQPKVVSVLPEPPSGLQLGFGYQGTIYAEEIPLQHGLSLWGRWVQEVGIYFGAGLSTTEVSTVETSFLTVDVARSGGQLFAGYGRSGKGFAVAVDFRYQGEIISRRVLDQFGALRPAAPGNRWQSALGFSVRGGVGLSDSLGLYAGPSAFLVLNNFQSIAVVDGVERVVLSPHRVRLLLDVGLAVWP